MNSVVNTSLSRLSLVLSIFVSVCLSRVDAADCGPEKLIQCARPLQVLSATSHLTFVTKKEELASLCPDLYTGLRCIHSYSRLCMTPQQREHFKLLYRGSELVIRDICNKGKYQDEFLAHAPCMHNVRAEYEVCARRYQETMIELTKPRNETKIPSRQTRHELRQKNATEQQPLSQDEEEIAVDKVKTVCCSWNEFVGCSQVSVQRRCGNEAAIFTRNFLDKMSSSLIETHCSEYENEFKEIEYLTDYSIDNSASTTNPWTGLVVAAVPLLFLR